MTLDELLDGDEGAVHEWLAEHDLVHECDCGYTVYDPDDVNEVVQAEWGDERCDEVYSWACNLSNAYGWMFLERSQPEFDIYHCQHCSGSELSLLLDMQKAAEAVTEEGEADPVSEAPSRSATMGPTEFFVAYVDESYTNGFPRGDGGCLAYSAFIVPESAVAGIAPRVEEILRKNYRGSPAAEIKYSQISRHPRLLEGIGEDLVNYITGIPNCAVIALFVPREGFFREKQRSIEAVAHYDSVPPDEDKLREATSTASVEEAVKMAANMLAETLAGCIATYLGPRAASATVHFDPRTSSLDQALRDGLESVLPAMPVKMPLIRHGDAIVTSIPSADVERWGDRVQVKFDRNSRQCHGLQIADFLAGDIRAFFHENPTLLDIHLSSRPLVNDRLLFPQVFKATPLTPETLAILEKRHGSSFLPSYRTILANGAISYYARNGQMRHLSTLAGEVYDMVD